MRTSRLFLLIVTLWIVQYGNWGMSPELDAVEAIVKTLNMTIAILACYVFGGVRDCKKCKADEEVKCDLGGG